MQTIREALDKLKKSSFRSSFHLKEKEKDYIKSKGMEVIESHTYDFIKSKIGHYDVNKDGSQTPMKGHPAFIAMHACACCCRGCLYKWYNVPKEKDLTENEINRIVRLLTEWMKEEL